MTSPRLTVVIPTRERCDTLAATLQSCVDQDSDDIDILVSDCASRDGTRDVVATFKDPRLRYVNPGESLPMTRHWEFALSHVPNGGWVTYLGDDDALMPNAARDILALLTDTHARALSWLKAEYCWPDHIWPAYRDRLIVPLDNQLHRMPAISARNDAARFWLGYNKLPCIYNGVLPRDAMAAISAKHGRFFDGFAPDAFSGIAILSMIDSYLYSTRPFSVNGASRHSNGTAVV